jgi:hypothetical protein
VFSTLIKSPFQTHSRRERRKPRDNKFNNYFSRNIIKVDHIYVYVRGADGEYYKTLLRKYAYIEQLKIYSKLKKNNKMDFRGNI